MPLHKRASKKIRRFNQPVSYKIGAQDRMNDAANVCTIQDVLETRHGISRYNSTAFSAAPQSISFFEEADGTKHIIVKDGTSLYTTSQSGAHAAIKTGLSAGTKHRGVTVGDRHIILIEGDGLFSWDGTTFTQLGQAPLGAPNVAASGSGKTLTASSYQVAVTGYASTLGFETNIGTSSSVVAVSSGQQIDVTSIPNTAANGFIDKIRVYVRDFTNNGPWLFWDEINLGTATETIDADPTSSLNPPTKNAAPISGGGKFPVVFGQSLAYAGNSTFKSDVFISEPLVPDAFDSSDTSRNFKAAGNGPITGIGVGYYNNNAQSPYMTVFKRNTIELYTELNGFPEQVVISNELGCVSHDTITTINGNVFFLSTQGWHMIQNGRIFQTKDKENTIDNGDIRDIFARPGFEYELSKTNMENFFSVYYPTLNQYLTFISEGTGTDINKAYNYEFEIGGFRPYTFEVTFNGGVLGQDESGNDVIYLIGEGGYVYKHSVSETQGTDIDSSNTDVAISAFAELYWITGDDMESSYNFGSFVIRAYNQTNPVTVEYFLNYAGSDPSSQSFDFSGDDLGFVLDISQLDVGIFDQRQIVRYVGEVLKSAQSILIKISKSQQGESMQLLEGQLDVNKNGNPN